MRNFVFVAVLTILTTPGFNSVAGGSMIGGGDQPLPYFDCRPNREDGRLTRVRIFDDYSGSDSPYSMRLTEGIGMEGDAFSSIQNVAAKVDLDIEHNLHLVFSKDGVKLTILAKSGQPTELPQMQSYDARLTITDSKHYGRTVEEVEAHCHTPR